MSTNLSGESVLGDKHPVELSSTHLQDKFLKRFEDPLQIPDKFQKDALSGRDPEFKVYRDGIYDDMIDNPCLLFNFFVDNNDILKKIELRDYAQIYSETLDYQIQVTAATFGGILGTAVVNN